MPEIDDPDRPRWPRGPFASVASETAPNSLFLEILDWLLAPLLILWPISIAFTNHYAHLIADEAFDGGVIESVRVLRQYIDEVTPPVPQRLPRAVQTVLTGDGVDTRYFRVSASPTVEIEPSEALTSEFVTETNAGLASRRRRAAIRIPVTPYDAGALALPLADQSRHNLHGEIVLRDDLIYGEPVRVATAWIPEDVAHRRPELLVQVAETRVKREAMVSRIIRGVLLPQFAMIPAAVILTFFGLARGLAPLRRLRDRILARRPGDLSPLTSYKVPEEVRPVLQALNGMMARLEVNLHAQQQFVANAAHQLRTPLTGLKMQADLALDEVDPERLRHSLRLIAESADRAAHLTNQLLTLARAEASHEKLLRFEGVDLRVLVRAATLQLVDSALSKDIDLSFDCDDWPHITEGVPLLLNELVSNLIDNAIKYTPRNGKVVVRMRSADFEQVEIEDSGPGIAPENRDKVFERFFRVLGNEANGSGLGLPIVREIAELHRARIELLDGELGGCLFRVSFVRRGDVSSPVEMRFN